MLPATARPAGGSHVDYPQARTLADAIFPRFGSEGRLVALVRDLTLMFGFAAVVALFAQIAIRLPWTTVPITGQTFAVLVTGGALGARRGAGCLTVYMLLGLPWRGSEGYVWDISSGGYVVGFILAAALVGYLAERRWDRGPWVHVAMLLGNVALYVPGLLWLAYLLETDWIVPGAGKPPGELISGSRTPDKTLTGGLYPL